MAAVPPEPPLLSDAQIAEIASNMRVADPTVDNGAFSSLTRPEMVTWLHLLGAPKLSSRSAPDLEIARRLRLGLWDSQRIDNYFPGKGFCQSPKLSLSNFPTWPDWKKAHPELKSNTIETVPIDGFKDAARLDSYVFRHFSLSAFTQMEIMQGAVRNASPDIKGAWIGSKALMVKAAMDITRDGGAATPFVNYFVNGRPKSIMLVVEFLDVKQVTWPEPSKKAWDQIKTIQAIKFGQSARGPVVPMLQTPKMPLIVVRYSYMEGRPYASSKFMAHLAIRAAETIPDVSEARVRELLQRSLRRAEPENHLRMFARLLSFNSTLLDSSYVEELQSHRNGLSRDVIEETRISFIVPCLRLRWRAIEEIETGYALKMLGATCNACGQSAEKLLTCASCKSVFYCGTNCNKADWPNHKGNCKLSKRLLTDPRSFPENKLYVSARTYVYFIPEDGYAIEQEAIKYSGSAYTNECTPNEYGNERFLVYTQMPPTYSQSGQYQGQTIFLWDRRRSLWLRTSPGDPPMARQSGMSCEIPFHQQGYTTYVRMVRQRGFQGKSIYLWAKRIGDCIELDMEDIPDQASIRWV